MTFVIRMLWREIRSSWSRLGFFFLCVGLGVAAIIMLRSVAQHVRTTLTREARSLVGADLAVQSTRPFTGDVRSRIDAVLAESGIRDTTEFIDTQTMAAPLEGQGTGQVRLVELRGVEPAFPYYGAIELEGGGRFTYDLVKDHGVVVQPELLIGLGLRVGDGLRLAGRTFTVRGVFVRDRVQRGGIAFGPRVYIDLADLRSSSLLGFGSRATYQLLARVDEPALRPLANRLRTALRQDIASVRTWQGLEDRIGRNLTLAENYLSLVGFAIVVLGGIGVWSVTRVIIQQKLRSVAILKCLGATSGRVFAIYVLQVLLLALVGSFVGLALAAAALALIPQSLVTALGVTSVSVTPSAALQGAAVGILVSLLFALVPLLEIRQVKPLLLLRSGAAAAPTRRDWRTWVAGALVAAALALVAMWQSDSIRAGAFVSGALAVVALLLHVVSRLLIRLTRPLLRSRRFAVRHAVVSLVRPGNQTRVILMAVGLGCFFVLGVRAVQANLLHQISTQVGEQSPDFIVIDVQSDQVASVKATIEPFLREPARIMPLMRGRVVAIEGRRVQAATVEDVRRHGRLTREFGLTFRANLEPNERLVSGSFWSDRLTEDRLPGGADTEVSIEREAASEARIEIGDVLTFDVAGQRIRARVASVRNVIWDDSQNGGFVFVLRPAPAVERAPHNYVGFLQVRDDPTARGTLQRDLVRTHPNVSAINVRDVIASIQDLVSNITMGVTIVGMVTLFGGVLILVGAVVMTKFQRMYDSAIYRTLGASNRMVTAMVAVEYGLLGLLAGALGAAGALGLSWMLARYLFEIDWRPAPLLLTAGMMLTAAIVSLVGVAVSADVLVRKPLEVLRSE
jgi:putative ABC transport system permease protein